VPVAGAGGEGKAAQQAGTSVILETPATMVTTITAETAAVGSMVEEVMAAVMVGAVEETVEEEAAIKGASGRTPRPYDRPAIILRPYFTSASSIRSGWPLTVASTMSPTPAT
jgi:hypothetical protein